MTATTEELFELDCESRYDYFLDKVADERELWILVNEEQQFLKIYVEDGDMEYLPVWPDAECAARYQSGSDKSLKPSPVSLPEFYKKWVPGLSGDSLDVGVFPADDGVVWLLKPEELKKDLDEVLSGAF
jgi:hypothetical protein